MKEHLKDLRQNTLSIHEYKYRFDELVKYFSDLSNEGKKIVFIYGTSKFNKICLEKHIT